MSQMKKIFCKIGELCKIRRIIYYGKVKERNIYKEEDKCDIVMKL